MNNINNYVRRQQRHTTVDVAGKLHVRTCTYITSVDLTTLSSPEWFTQFANFVRTYNMCDLAEIVKFCGDHYP